MRILTVSTAFAVAALAGAAAAQDMPTGTQAAAQPQDWSARYTRPARPGERGPDGSAATTVEVISSPLVWHPTDRRARDNARGVSAADNASVPETTSARRSTTGDLNSQPAPANAPRTADPMDPARTTPPTETPDVPETDGQDTDPPNTNPLN